MSHCVRAAVCFFGVQRMPGFIAHQDGIKSLVDCQFHIISFAYRAVFAARFALSVSFDALNISKPLSIVNIYFQTFPLGI